MALTRGTRVGPYEVLDPIGAGGMGEVYRAHDPGLARDVALKVLPSAVEDDERVQRFEQEARAIGALNHPNILSVYAAGIHDGRPYVASELLEGDTLQARLRSGTLSPRKSIEIGTQIARGLAAAHAKGIVHRDLKPANVFITRDGLVKILDFGLAKLLTTSADGTQTASMNLDAPATMPGTVMGTAGYMSPEQVRGQPLDYRSDIFSFGIVLCEMLAGRRPFRGDTVADTMAGILKEDPVLPEGDVSPALSGILRRCLEKRPDDRFRSTDDLAFALEAISGSSNAMSTSERPSIPWRTMAGVMAVLLASLTAIYLRSTRDSSPPTGMATVRSLAVLPFKPLDPAGRDEALELGMADSLITRLSRIRRLVVRPTSAVRGFTAVTTDAVDAGRKLQVESVLEGHIQRSADRIRVTVRLIRVSSGEAVWTSQFDEGAYDIFAVQDSISQKVAAAVGPTLSGGEQALITTRETENPEAYRLYLTGRFFWSRMTADGLNEAIRSYDRAIQLDPRFALAHAGIADANGMLGTWGFLPHNEAFPRAEQAALRALALDDRLAEAHTSLGYSKFRYSWDWPAAQQEFARAIALNPNYPTARQFYAEYLIVSKRFDEALVELNRAQDLDPLSLYVRMQAATRFYFMRRYDDAIQHLREVTRMDPTYAIAYGLLGACYREKGLHTESVNANIDWLRLNGFDENDQKALRRAFDSSGVRGFDRQSVELFKKRTDGLHFVSIFIAMSYALLGEKQSALDWLERARDARHGWLTELDVDPVWDSLRKEPRFARLVEQVHIPR